MYGALGQYTIKMEFFEFVRKGFQNYGNYQRGEGVTTRRQAATAQQQQQEQQQQPLETVVRPNNIDENIGQHAIDDVNEVLNEPSIESMEQDNVLEQEIEERDETNLYNKETLIAENDLVKVYILKDYFKRQKIFK